MSAHGTELHDIDLTLPAQAENLAVVRQAIAGLAVARGAPRDLVDDIRTAVTEACMNAVVHAYPDREEPGPLDVTAEVDDARLVICVRDYGVGIRPVPVEEDAPSLRLGLPLIGALADELEISGGGDRGTAIRIVFYLDRDDARPPAEQEPRLSGAETKLVASTNGGSGAIGPVISMLAARLDFSVDRLSDLHLVGDLLASAVPPSHDESPLHVSIKEESSPSPMLVISIGPMQRGAADRIIDRADLAGMGNALERVVNRVYVEEQGADQESLVLEVAKQR
jgi:anti-sigma regulatory factor (Ser/Thr protein kinase)